MNQWNLESLSGYLRTSGRTLVDVQKKALFFNWSCAGFEVRFTGRVLRAQLLAIGMKAPMDPNETMEYPCIGVVADDGETLRLRAECRESGWYTLWEADEPGTYTVRVVKLSEGARGKIALAALESDGVLEPLPEKPVRPRIEFVGDSITCGFGNEAPSADTPFLPSQENGWMAYGALAARELGADYQAICVSGITVSAAKRPLFQGMPAMDQLYRYTDRLYSEQAGLEPEQWDFAGHLSDIVVINLGTNDVNPIRFARECGAAAEEEAYFVERYIEFLRQVRTCNGADTWIVATLGMMDYYLYDRIRDAVDAYVAMTGDRRIQTFKLIGINVMTEGYGAAVHPSMKTHIRAGHELAAHLRPLLAYMGGV